MISAHGKTQLIPMAALQGMPEVIVHANCPDGLASAMILHDALLNAKVTFVHHNTPEHRSEPRRAIWCDMAPHVERNDDGTMTDAGRAYVQRWVDAGAVVLDHHASARDVVEMFGDRGVFADEDRDVGVSGALLACWAWSLLRPSACMVATVNAFATLAGIRDTWQTKHADFPRACEQAAALMLFGPDYLLGDDHGPWLNGHEMAAGASVYSDTQRRAREIAEQAPVIGRALVFNESSARRLCSDVAEHARAIGRDCDLVVGFSYTLNMEFALSMRAVADIDVSAIAKRHGGGGHRGAAGCQLSADEARWENPVDLVTWALTWVPRGSK